MDAPDQTTPTVAPPGRPWMVDGFNRSGTRHFYATLAEARDERIEILGRPHGVYDEATGRLVN
jgi:hypothetical protein